MENQSLFLVIRSRDRVIYEGEVKALTSINEKGVFDVLPEHAGFISLIREFVRIHEQGGQIKELKIQTGIVKVANNSIRVYVGLVPQEPVVTAKSITTKS